MKDLMLFESEYKLMDIIWDNEPVRSGELVKMCEKAFDWKKSTTYTVLSKLAAKGIASNVDSVVTSVIPREKIREAESEELVKRSFGGSLPAFVNAFLSNGSITESEAEELIELIETHIKDKGAAG